LLTNTIIDLSSNDFVGEILASIGTLHCLILLNLSRNHVEGEIPKSLSEIYFLEKLDLFVNNLSGMIRQELSKLSMLASFNFSWNNLCGPIPIGTQFDNLDATIYESNKCLCGNPLQPCKRKKVTPVTVATQVPVGSKWFDQVDEKISLNALGLGF